MEVAEEWFPPACLKHAGWPNLTLAELKRMLKGFLPVHCSRKPGFCVFCISSLHGREENEKVRRDHQVVLAVLCGELFEQVVTTDSPTYLENLFLLAQCLGERLVLMKPALKLESRVRRGRIKLSKRLRHQLTLAVIRNQADASLQHRWIRTLVGKGRTRDAQELLEAFNGVVWLPFDEENCLAPVEAIREALPILAARLEKRENGFKVLRYALRTLRVVYPCDRWREWLEPGLSSWRPFLQRAVNEEYPFIGGA